MRQGFLFEFPSMSTDAWCNNSKKRPVFQRVGWSIAVSRYKHGGKLDFFGMKCSVFEYERRWQLQNSFSLHFLFDPSTASSRQASSSSPSSSCPPLSSNLLFHISTFSSQQPVSSGTQLWLICLSHWRCQTNRQPESPSFSPESESQFGAGRLIQNQAICAVCTPPSSTVGSLCDYK